MVLFIKNMVCERCILAVKRELDEMSLYPASIELGSVEMNFDLNKQQLKKLTIEW